MTNHVELLFAAVSVLAGNGHIKQRLIKAYEDHVDQINDDELPLAVKESFSTLRHQMYRVAPLNGEGPICASVRKMSIQEADARAKSIVELYRDARRFGGSSEVGVPLGHEDELKIPPFLVKSG